MYLAVSLNTFYNLQKVLGGVPVTVAAPVGRLAARAPRRIQGRSSSPKTLSPLRLVDLVAECLTGPPPAPRPTQQVKFWGNLNTAQWKDALSASCMMGFLIILFFLIYSFFILLG